MATPNDQGSVQVNYPGPDSTISPAYVLIDIDHADIFAGNHGTNTNSADNLVAAINAIFPGTAIDDLSGFGGILSTYHGAAGTNYDVAVLISPSTKTFDFQYDFSQVAGLGPDEIVNIGVVPEPASLGLVALGAFGGLSRIRRRRAPQA